MASEQQKKKLYIFQSNYWQLDLLEPFEIHRTESPVVWLSHVIWAFFFNIIIRTLPSIIEHMKNKNGKIKKETRKMWKDCHIMHRKFYSFNTFYRFFFKNKIKDWKMGSCWWIIISNYQYCFSLPVNWYFLIILMTILCNVHSLRFDEGMAINL